MAVAAAAPSLVVLALGIGVAGTTSVVAQVLVPFASSLAAEDEAGRVVGTVMSGLLIGILVARTVSGVLAELVGWRGVFVVAALAMVALAAALHRALPDVPPPSSLPYRKLLRSIVTLVREQPVLRLRMAYGALGMASFSIVWTALSFLLAGEPYGYGDATIGLFGLAGLVGALSAQAAGRLSDGGRGHAATGAFLAANVAAWGLLALGGDHVVALVAGIVLLDLGIQGQHILNQSTIYALAPDARSRLTTAYMTSNFLRAALGSAAAAGAWSAGGWPAVCGVGAAASLAALATYAAASASRRPASSSTGIE